jgi:hypothetical protein
MLAAISHSGKRYLVFAAALFLRSAHRFFIISDSFLRPAALSLLAGFALAALLPDALFMR